ncbi:uncharacterized protein ACOB8E_004196 [Sarcophilus harrisii]
MKFKPDWPVAPHVTNVSVWPGQRLRKVAGAWVTEGFWEVESFFFFFFSPFPPLPSSPVRRKAGKRRADHVATETVRRCAAGGELKEAAGTCGRRGAGRARLAPAPPGHACAGAGTTCPERALAAGAAVGLRRPVTRCSQSGRVRRLRSVPPPGAAPGGPGHPAPD